MKTDETGMLKNLDERVRLQSEKRVNTRDKRKLTTRDCSGQKQRSHCSLIVQWKETVSAREFEVKRKDGGEDRTRVGEKAQTCCRCRDQPRVCKMTQVLTEKLEQIGRAEEERVAQCHKASS